MNEDILKGNWKQFKGKAKKNWGKLTDDDLDVVEAAVSVDIRNFEHASNRIKENEMIVLDLTKKYGSVIRYSSNKLLTNPDFMLKAIKVYSVSIKYISHELKENNDFIDEVIKIDKWNKEYLKGC